MTLNRRIADSDRFVHWSVFKTVFLYAAFATLWILFSDQAVVLKTSDPKQIALFGTIKGLFFVTVTSLLLAYMMHRFFSRLAAVADELKINEERWKFALEGAGDGVWDWDIQTGAVNFSRRWKDMLGYSESEIGNDFDEWKRRVHPDDIEAAQARIKAYFEGGSPNYVIEHRMRCKDGSWKWVLSRGMIVSRTPDGQPLRMIGTHADISERKNAEADLRIAAAAFDARESMMITDAHTVIQRVNRAFTENTGYSAEEVIGKTPAVLRSSRHNADFFRTMWESIKETGGWQGEIWDRRKNGEEYVKWLTISAVRNLDGAVTHYIGVQYDITERKQAEEKIHQLAFFDHLTGLPNRTLLLDRLKQTKISNARSGAYGALLMIDLDNFKMLNDTLGHDMGDLLLKQVAHRLIACVRAEDTVARLGGDEFLVVLANMGKSKTEAANRVDLVGEKILAELNLNYQLNDVIYHCTPSIGASLFQGQQTEIDVLLKQADLAMYRAKDAGRNAIRFFDPDMERVVMKRAALEKDLRNAIHEQQFILHYQAQVAGDRLTGAEVLVRWQHPERGLVPPFEFIPIAEETGLILPIGRWVLETACKQLAAWSTQPTKAHLTIAVNVSAHQFRQADFVDQVLGVLKETGANPQRLKLELTESLLVANVDEIIEKMFSLKAKGVGFSLDDFGTGYSSLSYLKRLPLDHLKIDQSFVRDVLSDPNDASIAKTIIALADSLGIGVIAEGVENALQRDFLAHAGCHTYQGYFFGRPVPIEAFEQLTLQ